MAGFNVITEVSSNPEHRQPGLVEDVHAWMLQARGARQLINGADVRIGIERPRSGNLSSLDPNGKPMDVSFVLAGFARVRGKIPPMHIGRVFDSDGEVLGYTKLSGSNLLFNTHQEKTFHALPERFTFTQAKQRNGHGDQSTTDFLKKCLHLGIVVKDGREYCKMYVGG
jgi:hypothetical protein